LYLSCSVYQRLQGVCERGARNLLLLWR